MAKKNNEDTMRVGEVLMVLEQMQGSISLIAENQSGTNKRLDSIDQRLDVVDQRLDTMDQRFDAMDQRFDAMDQRFDQVDEKFKEVDNKFELVMTYLMRIEDEISDMKDELKVLKRNHLVTLDQAVDFEKRLKFLEKGFAKVKISA